MQPEQNSDPLLHPVEHVLSNTVNEADLPVLSCKARFSSSSCTPHWKHVYVTCVLAICTHWIHLSNRQAMWGLPWNIQGDGRILMTETWRKVVRVRSKWYSHCWVLDAWKWWGRGQSPNCHSGQCNWSSSRNNKIASWSQNCYAAVTFWLYVAISKKQMTKLLQRPQIACWYWRCA